MMMAVEEEGSANEKPSGALPKTPRVVSSVRSVNEVFRDGQIIAL